MNDNIQFKLIDDQLYEDCLALEVNMNQKEFVMDIKEIYKVYQLNRNGIEPLAIFHNDVLIGVLVYKTLNYHDSYFLWQLLIDHRYQQKGFGKKSILKLLKELKNKGGCTKVTTTVVKDNNILPFYLQLGFEVVDEFEGEIDLEFQLSHL